MKEYFALCHFDNVGRITEIELKKGHVYAISKLLNMEIIANEDGWLVGIDDEGTVISRVSTNI